MDHMGKPLAPAELLFELATTRERFDTIAEMMRVCYGAKRLMKEWIRLAATRRRR